MIDAERMNILEHGACNNLPTGWFMPDNITTTETDRYRIIEEWDEDKLAKAKLVCRTCPVQHQCRTWALNNQENPIGLWGGMTHLDRRRQKRRTADNRPKQTCLDCGKLRLLKFFPEPELAVCATCMRLAEAAEPPPTCRVEACGDIAVAKSLCNKHYLRWFRHGTLTKKNGTDDPPRPRGQRRKKQGRPRKVPSDRVMLEMFGEGLGNDELAELWGVTASTVRTHRSRLGVPV